MISKKMFRQFLGVWVALLLLTAAVAGKSVTSLPGHYPSAEQTPADSGEESKTYFSELSIQAVVIASVAFDFATPIAILPSPLVAFIETKVVLPPSFSIPFHWICYFSKIFGHLIAINAP